MHKGRLEAFSDAVIAIALTIMVLELHPPHEPTLEAMRPLVWVFSSYVLSFTFLGIYWNNHHHMLQAAKHVNGSVLWANMHLLFWLSLTPFVTAWVGKIGISSVPVAAYGVVLLFSGVASYILSRTLIAANGRDSALAQALGRDAKGKLSVLVYLIAIGVAFAAPVVSCVLYVGVALAWLVPDRRFEGTGGNV